MKKSHHITDKLLAGLGRAKLPAVPPQVQAAAVKSVAAKKTTLHFFPHDLERINEIQGYFAANREFITTSEAIRAALRAIVFNEELLKVLPTIRAADPRRQKRK